MDSTISGEEMESDFNTQTWGWGWREKEIGTIQRRRKRWKKEKKRERKIMASLFTVAEYIQPVKLNETATKQTATANTSACMPQAR